ncbi:MAG: phosphatase PAP2 family protein [Xanthomonadaceae bacterium]|nr:phosphatase PAP2 family protein [Xanthomonadaceae bacterium]
MKFKKSVFVLFVSFFHLSGWAAEWTEIKSKEFNLANPPEEGSVEEKKDFKILHDYQKNRTEEECKLADSMSAPTLKALFGGKNGKLTDAEIKKAGELFGEVFDFADRVSGHFKSKYMRPRPFNVDQTLKPCITKPGGAKAYPSSHSVMGVAGACLLAEVFPKKAKELKAWGKRIGELRVLGGVHHPSDVIAGRNLGQQICDRLLSEKTFLDDLEEL